MLGVRGRKPAAVVVEPIARALSAMGISPNMITVGATIAACVAALWLIPAGHLFAAAVTIGVLTAVDMVDGTMARMRGGGTVFGAVLDASCDRITDGAIFAAMAWWILHSENYHPRQFIAVMIVLVTSQVISYVKARAEASGIAIVGGLVERPERLIIGLVALGLEGLGVPHVLEVGLWLLAVGSIFTVIQRLVFAHRSPIANQKIKAPAGAKEFPDAYGTRGEKDTHH